MADDQSQRPYRASEPPLRGPAKSAANDPLAELARLIGQTDPFAEYGRDTARRAAAPPASDPSDWSPQPGGTSYPSQGGADPYAPAPSQRTAGNGYYSARPAPVEQPAAAQGYGSQSYGRQAYGGTQLPSGEDRYQAEQEARDYGESQGGYQQQDLYDHDTAQQGDEEYYDDVPPTRRRIGIMAIAGVFALAVIGTAGAFGYRAMFGSSASHQPPPVIKADTGPSKVVPATTGRDSQSGKLITDRINELGQGEKLVSREEQPVDKAQGVQQAALGSGVVTNEPKKVRTIAIRPDQSATADATPVSAAPLAAAPAGRAAIASAPSRPSASPPRAPTESNTSADAEQDSPPAPARPAPAVRQITPAPGGGNAPLSLNPNVQPARPAAAAPTRTASVPPAATAAPAAAATAGGAYVQISSQRSEAEAQAAFRGLQAKFPTQLGGRQAQIHKADLGAKGTYYRAMVGPFANAGEAVELCTSLKAAGGQCLIQKN